MYILFNLFVLIKNRIIYSIKLVLVYCTEKLLRRLIANRTPVGKNNVCSCIHELVVIISTWMTDILCKFNKKSKFHENRWHHFRDADYILVYVNKNCFFKGIRLTGAFPYSWGLVALKVRGLERWGRGNDERYANARENSKFMSLASVCRYGWLYTRSKYDFI